MEPTDKEREIARHIAEEHARLDDAPRLAPDIANALARYRVEVQQAQREACAVAAARLMVAPACESEARAVVDDAERACAASANPGLAYQIAAAILAAGRDS